MYQQHLSRFPHINLVVAGELIFFIVFILIAIWVFRSSQKSYYQKLSTDLLDLEKEPTYE